MGHTLGVAAGPSVLANVVTQTAFVDINGTVLSFKKRLIVRQMTIEI